MLTHKEPKRAAIMTLGCKVNQYESDAMEELLLADGYEIVGFEQEAEVYIVNTCSVTNMAERKSRQMLHKAKKRNANAIIVAVGCYVQSAKQELLDDLAVDLVIGNNKKHEIVSSIRNYLNHRNEMEAWVEIGAEKQFEEMKLSQIAGHTRAYIKIQDGCNQFCSYCIIPYARGRVRSRLLEDIKKEIISLAEHGCKEIVLTGIHLSSYGVDLGNCTLLDAIALVSAVPGIERVRLGSLEPRIITKEFLGRLASIPEFCPHFHLSLQSACNATLQRMNRKYTIEEYMECCKLIRETFDRPAITTDVIVGFPGETEQEFEETVAHLQQLKLYEMHIFKYSKRRGTLAETMDHQVDETVKTRRSDCLLQMTKEQKEQYELQFAGEETTILIEEKLKNREGWYTGHTMRYQKIDVPYGQNIENQIVRVRIMEDGKTGEVLAIC